MSLPFFYIPHYNDGQMEFVLEEDNSRHIVQVLRMKPGESLLLTDGRGRLLTVTILDDHKKKCSVRVVSLTQYPRPEREVTIAISLLKNASRFEWFLEKAMEIGVSSIIPLLCERTEKSHFRRDRMQNILVSALLQSQQTWLPDLSEPTPFDTFLEMAAPPGTEAPNAAVRAPAARKYIAHCLEEQRLPLAAEVRKTTSPPQARPAEQTAPPQKAVSAPQSPSLILIGPEGDFSKNEIIGALQRGFIPVTLGETRLRTETAGIVAATLLTIF